VEKGLEHGILLAVSRNEESIKMVHRNANGLKGIVRPWKAGSLFPAMMVNPLGAMFVYMSGALLRLADGADRIKASQAAESEEKSSVLPDVEPAKLVEQRTRRRVISLASKDSGRTAQARKAKSHKRTHHKG
jgi:hypothetical protein